MIESPSGSPASTASELTRRYGLPLYWLAFAAITLEAARYPGFVSPDAPRAFPWDGVLVTWAILAFATALLHAILRPQTFCRSWGRLAGAIGYAVLLNVLTVATYVTDMAGYVYVPGRFAMVMLLGLMILAIALPMLPQSKAGRLPSGGARAA